MNLRFKIAAIALATLLLASCAATPGRVKQTKPVPALDAAHSLALEGYDVVAYFEAGEPQKGTSQFVYWWQGATWRFASAVRRDTFAADPLRYTPQYGSYCAYAVSRGTTAHGDPEVWAIVDNKLYLNNNRFAQQLWNEDRPGNIRAGELNWPLLPKR